MTSNLESTVHRARFVASPPTFTTEQAEGLEIEELVSEFTTYYSCCQPRVTNIKRAAELLARYGSLEEDVIAERVASDDAGPA